MLTEDEAVSISCQVAQALQHAYFNGLVHRDIKPENVMVTPYGAAKILDRHVSRPYLRVGSCCVRRWESAYERV